MLQPPWILAGQEGSDLTRMRGEGRARWLSSLSRSAGPPGGASDLYSSLLCRGLHGSASWVLFICLFCFPPFSLDTWTAVNQPVKAQWLKLWPQVRCRKVVSFFSVCFHLTRVPMEEEMPHLFLVLTSSFRP